MTQKFDFVKWGQASQKAKNDVHQKFTIYIPCKFQMLLTNQLRIWYNNKCRMSKVFKQRKRESSRPKLT